MSNTPQAATPALQTAGANLQRFNDLKQVVKMLGEQSGKGRDTQIRFALAVIEASFLGVVDLDQNKHGLDRDDASLLTEEYYKQQSSNTMFDTKAPNIRKAMACTRTYIRTGQWSCGGSQEPLQTIDKLMNIRQTLRKDPQTNGKLDDANNTMLKFGRKLLKNNALPDDQELRDMCYKKGRELPTAEELTEGYLKALTNLYNGNAVHKTVQDNSPEIDKAIKALRARMKRYATDRGAAQAVPQAQADGEADVTVPTPSAPTQETAGQSAG